VIRFGCGVTKLIEWSIVIVRLSLSNRLSESENIAKRNSSNKFQEFFTRSKLKSSKEEKKREQKELPIAKDQKNKQKTKNKNENHNKLFTNAALFPLSNFISSLPPRFLSSNLQVHGGEPVCVRSTKVHVIIDPAAAHGDEPTH
jgi:hypothetical protein